MRIAPVRVGKVARATLPARFNARRHRGLGRSDRAWYVGGMENTLSAREHATSAKMRQTYHAGQMVRAITPHKHVGKTLRVLPATLRRSDPRRDGPSLLSSGWLCSAADPSNCIAVRGFNELSSLRVDYRLSSSEFRLTISPAYLCSFPRTSRPFITAVSPEGSGMGGCSSPIRSMCLRFG